MLIENTKTRIAQYLERKSISKSKFYADIDIKRGLLDSDKMDSTVTDTIIAKILVTYKDIDPVWLLTGNGDMLLDDQDKSITQLKSQSILIDEPFLYKMYKEKEAENKDLMAKMLAMAEEIGNLKAQLNNQKGLSGHSSTIERVSDAFTQDSFVDKENTGEESPHMRNPISPAKPSHGKL